MKMDNFRDETEICDVYTHGFSALTLGFHICTNTRLLSCLKFSINHPHFLTLKTMRPLTHFTTTVTPAAEHVILTVPLNVINTILKLF